MKSLNGGHQPSQGRAGQRAQLTETWDPWGGGSHPDSAPTLHRILRGRKSLHPATCFSTSLWVHFHPACGHGLPTTSSNIKFHFNMQFLVTPRQTLPWLCPRTMLHGSRELTQLHWEETASYPQRQESPVWADTPGMWLRAL